MLRLGVKQRTASLLHFHKKPLCKHLKFIEEETDLPKQDVGQQIQLSSSETVCVGLSLCPYVDCVWREGLCSTGNQKDSKIDINQQSDLRETN